jgi:hypothetical protein
MWPGIERRRSVLPGDGNFLGVHGKEGDPEGVVSAFESDPLLKFCTANAEAIIGPVGDRRHRETESAGQGALQVSTDHIGQFAEDIADVVIDIAGGSDGEKPACKLAGLLPAALEL